MATQYYASGKKVEEKLSIGKFIGIALVIVLLGAIIFFGYSWLSTKISASNAVSELKQAQNIILSNVVNTSGGADYKINCDGVVFYYDDATGKVAFKGNINTSDEQFTKELKSKFSELETMNGSFTMENGSIVYITENGKGFSIWSNGDTPKSYNK